MSLSLGVQQDRKVMPKIEEKKKNKEQKAIYYRCERVYHDDTLKYNNLRFNIFFAFFCRNCSEEMKSGISKCINKSFNIRFASDT